jgi:hypothetical protein
LITGSLLAHEGLALLLKTRVGEGDGQAQVHSGAHDLRLERSRAMDVDAVAVLLVGQLQCGLDGFEIRLARHLRRCPSSRTALLPAR